MLARRASLGPAHVAGLDEAKRVVDAQRREHANVPRIVTYPQSYQPAFASLKRVADIPTVIIVVDVRRRTFNGTALPDSMTVIGFDLNMLSYNHR